MENRTTATTKNIICGIISKVVSLVLVFASRTIFIYFLNKELLGVNSLYAEILSMLSLAELGFGTAFTFAMYKPISDNDEEKIIQLLTMFKKVYNRMAIIVLALGLSLIPVLQYIVKGAEIITLNQLRIYYTMFLLNTVTAYFVNYKTTYVNARMESYVITNIEMVTNSIIIVAQCLSLIVFRDYLIYLAIHTVFLIISRVIISIYLDSKYPILRKYSNKLLDTSEKNVIYNEVKGLALQNFAGVAIHSTDNLLISMCSGLGIVGVGLVSNYNTLIVAVTSFVITLMTSLTPGFGNLIASSSQDHYRKCFYEVNFYDFWIYGFCSIAFFLLIPPFIQLWIGADYLIDTWSFLLIIINVYLQGQSTVYNSARIAKGNFNLDKWVSVCQAFINLIVSIVCAKLFGLIGIYIGTIASRLFFVILRPIKTYKFLYGHSCKEYFSTFTRYVAITLIAGVATYIPVTAVLHSQVNILTFIVSCLFVAVIPNVIFFLIFRKSDYLKILICRIRKLVKK